MGSLAGRMGVIDRQISTRIGETLLYGSVVVTGFFYKTYREIVLSENSVSGFDLSFDCQYSDVNTLDEGDQVEIFENDVPQGTYVVRRMLPEGGDESGLVIIELGSV